MKRDEGFRREQRERVIKNRVRFVKDVEEKNSKYSRKASDLVQGKLVKRHPADCGRADCQCCHLEKISKKSKRKRRNAEQRIDNDDEISDN